MLLNCGASPNIQNSLKYTVLHFACLQKNHSIVRSLCSHGANPFVQDPDGDSSVIIVVRMGNLVAFRYFYEKFDTKQFLLVRGAQGMNLLHIAALGGRREIATVLQRCGFSNTSLDACGYMPIHHAIVNGQVDILDLLNIDAQHREKVHIELFAIQFGSMAVVKKLSELGYNFSKAIVDGYTPAHFAVLNNDLEMLKCLAQLGAPLDTPNDAEKKPMDLSKNTQIEQFFKNHKPA